MYLDPGLGSMIIQIVVAGIAACGALLFSFRTRIKAWWAGRKGKATEEMEHSNDESMTKEIDKKDVSADAK